MSTCGKDLQNDRGGINSEVERTEVSSWNNVVWKNTTARKPEEKAGCRIHRVGRTARHGRRI